MDKELLIAAVEVLAKETYGEDVVIHPGPTLSKPPEDDLSNVNYGWYCKSKDSSTCNAYGYGATAEKAFVNLIRYIVRGKVFADTRASRGL